MIISSVQIPSNITCYDNNMVDNNNTTLKSLFQGKSGCGGSKFKHGITNGVEWYPISGGKTTERRVLDFG